MTPGQLTLVIGALAALVGLRQEPAVPAGVAATREVRAVPLGELRSNPARHLGEEVRFTLQFSRRLEDWNPFFSRFGPKDWLALEVWADESFLWEAAAFADPARHVFVARGSPSETLVRSARPYARFEAHGRVREVFLGKPWIEIQRLTPLTEEVGEGTIVHVGRALELWSQGQWDLALDQLDRAKAAPLPAHALRELERQSLEFRVAREAAARRR